MNAPKRILSALLALLMTALSLTAAVSCAQGKVPETTTAAGQTDGTPDESTEPGETEPQFSDAKYGGAEWKIYMRDQTNANYASLYVVPPENASDVISQEAMSRNAKTEERFDIHISAIEATNPYKTLKTDINAGEKLYDVILDQRRYVAPLGVDGCLVNLNKLEVNFNTSWLDGKAAENYSACGKLFVIPNDASISNLGGVRFWYFNKEVLDEFRLQSPYEYAEKNEWILDTFYGMIKSVSAPNADGTLGKYGLVNEEGYTRNAAIVGSAIPWINKIDETTFECRIGTDYADKAQVIFDKLKTIVEDKNCCLSFDEAHQMDPAGQSSYNDKYAHARGLFATGHFLFVHSNMNSASEFTEMKKGFGVIMNPKYSPDQEEYYHRMDSNSIIFSLPKFADADPQSTIEIMDYWGYVSHSTSMEAYYELTLKTKRASDPTAAGVLDTVKATISYSISEIFANSSYSIDIGDFMTAAYSSSVAKGWKTYKRPIENGIKKVIEALDAMEE